MFKLFRIRQHYLRFIRGMNIAFILLSYFWVNWMSSGRIMKRFVSRRYKRDGKIISRHERLRTVIERLGPTFIKFGQILADRPDIISEKLRTELKKLQSSAEPFDRHTAMELIEEELGAPIDHYFEWIEPRCIGSASIGQVYKGVLKNGDEVVVKIQRPHIREKIALDLQLLQFLAVRLAKEYPELVVIDITGFVKEFGDTIMRELNYFNEAGNAIRFAEMFKDAPYCKIPRVYTDLSTHKLLVMEYIEGVLPDDREVLIAHGLDPKEVAHNGVQIFLKMIFEHGFFHADPHAGNMFIQKGNRIALIDFGMVGSLKPSHMEFLAKFTLGVATKNAQMIGEALVKLNNNSAKLFKEHEDLEFLLQGMLNRYGALTYEKIKFSKVLDECVNIILRFELKIPGSIYLLIKSLATIEKVGYNLDPTISLSAHIRPYAVALVRRQYSLKAIAGELYDVLRAYVKLVRNFPGEVTEIMHNIKQGKLVHDIRLDNTEGFSGAVRLLGRNIALAFIIGMMMAGSALMMKYSLGTDRLAEAVFIVSCFAAFWLLLKLFFRK